MVAVFVLFLSSFDLAVACADSTRIWISSLAERDGCVQVATKHREGILLQLMNL